MCLSHTGSRFVLSRSADDLFSISGIATSRAQAIAAELCSSNKWLEVVAGIDSVVVQFDACKMTAAEAEMAIGHTLQFGVANLQPRAELIEVPVHYGGDDGPDLDAVCRTLGMSSDELIELHCGRDYSVDMIGFTPGFAFIGGLDEQLRISRHPEPRQQVAAGSIGIADGRTGIYAIASPGGWPLIGRTDMRLFDSRSEEPFKLRAGMRVRFRPVDGQV